VLGRRTFGPTASIWWHFENAPNRRLFPFRPFLFSTLFFYPPATVVMCGSMKFLMYTAHHHRHHHHHSSWVFVVRLLHESRCIPQVDKIQNLQTSFVIPRYWFMAVNTSISLYTVFHRRKNVLSTFRTAPATRTILGWKGFRHSTRKRDGRDGMPQSSIWSSLVSRCGICIIYSATSVLTIGLTVKRTAVSDGMTSLYSPYYRPIVH